MPHSMSPTNNAGIRLAQLRHGRGVRPHYVAALLHRYVRRFLFVPFLVPNLEIARIRDAIMFDNDVVLIGPIVVE
jgi:hypothetical protein